MGGVDKSKKRVRTSIVKVDMSKKGVTTSMGE